VTPRSFRLKSAFQLGARIGLGAILAVGVVLSLSSPQALLPFLSYGIVGSLLVIRRPRHPIGWLLLLMSAAFGMVGRQDVVAWAVANGHTAWLPLVAWIETMAAIGFVACVVFLAAVFPTGALPTGGSGRATRIAVAVVGVVVFLQAVGPSFTTLLPDGSTVVFPNPIGIALDWPGWSYFLVPAYVVLLGGLVVCLLGLLARFRHSTGIERQQDKWFLASVAFIAAAIAFGFVLALLVDPTAAWAWLPALLAFQLPPIAIGIAIMRYRLYEIDRIVSRTIAYGLISATLLVVYAAVILVLQGPLGAITGGETLAVAASTLVAAALFQPVRRRIQAAVDHRFNRAGYDAERTIAGLAARLRDQMDLPVVRTAIVDAVVQSVEPTGATLWLRLGRTR
jgi:hypothetical protein